jgi:hypothetical protein
MFVLLALLLFGFEDFGGHQVLGVLQVGYVGLGRKGPSILLRGGGEGSREK